VFSPLFFSRCFVFSLSLFCVGFFLFSFFRLSLHFLTAWAAEAATAAAITACCWAACAEVLAARDGNDVLLRAMGDDDVLEVTLAGNMDGPPGYSGDTAGDSRGLMLIEGTRGRSLGISMVGLGEACPGGTCCDCCWPVGVLELFRRTGSRAAMARSRSSSRTSFSTPPRPSGPVSDSSFLYTSTNSCSVKAWLLLGSAMEKSQFTC